MHSYTCLFSNASYKGWAFLSTKKESADACSVSTSFLSNRCVGMNPACVNEEIKIVDVFCLISLSTYGLSILDHGSIRSPQYRLSLSLRTLSLMFADTHGTWQSAKASGANRHLRYTFVWHSAATAHLSKCMPPNIQRHAICA